MPFFRHVLAGVDVAAYFRASLDCGCTYLRTRGVEPCREHADDVLFQTTFARVMLDLAKKLDCLDGLMTRPGMQKDVRP